MRCSPAQTAATPIGATTAAARPFSDLMSNSSTTMATNPPNAAMTMMISSATGRRSFRWTLARVAAASIGQSTTQPDTTVLVPARGDADEHTQQRSGHEADHQADHGADHDPDLQPPDGYE